VEFDIFCSTVSHELIGVTEAAEIAFAVDDGEEMLMGAAHRDAADAFLAELDRVIVGRNMAALATRVMWSPDEGPTRPAWMLTAVAKGKPAFFAVKRNVEDERWWLIPPGNEPWFALSTAGGLRAALEQGEPMHLKNAENNEVYQTPKDVPHPPVDKHGRI
jgi:hypothetical protein